MSTNVPANSDNETWEAGIFECIDKLLTCNKHYVEKNFDCDQDVYPDEWEEMIDFIEEYPGLPTVCLNHTRTFAVKDPKSTSLHLIGLPHRKPFSKKVQTESGIEEHHWQWKIWQR